MRAVLFGLAVASSSLAVSGRAQAEPVDVPVYEFLWPRELMRAPSDPYIAELPVLA